MIERQIIETIVDTEPHHFSFKAGRTSPSYPYLDILDSEELDRLVPTGDASLPMQLTLANPEA